MNEPLCQIRQHLSGGWFSSNALLLTLYVIRTTSWHKHCKLATASPRCEYTFHLISCVSVLFFWLSDISFSVSGKILGGVFRGECMVPVC